MVAVTLAALLACTRKAADDAYFPLATGRSWTYTLTAEDSGETPITLQATIEGPVEVGGVKVTRERIEVQGRKHFLFIGVDEHGIYRHATQSDQDPTPSLAGERDYFLVMPLELGKSWKGVAGPSFLEVGDTDVPIESTVESTTETIRTPAGEFKDCVRVHVTGSVEIRNEFLEDDDDPAEKGHDADNDEDWDPVGGTFTLDEQTWYAKDVGVVKSIVTETFKGKSDNDDRARVTTELQAFTR
jgi:hypothetical protein